MTDDELGASLAFLSRAPLDQYLWLQDSIHDAMLAPGSLFAVQFNAFYRLRGAVGKHQDVYYTYFAELRQAKAANAIPTFSTALREFATRLQFATGKDKLRAEASFVSKMLATLDPDRPVFDSVVLASLELDPRTHRADKLTHAETVYNQLEARMSERLRSPAWPAMRTKFNEHFADRDVVARVTDMKALDLIIWGAGGRSAATR